MFNYEKFIEVKKLTDSIGQIYGTEDFAVYLYSIVKMYKPSTVVEYGTGLGSTALWIALALEENKLGILHTIDDGSEWDDLKQAKDRFKPYFKERYEDYILNLVNVFDFSKEIRFYNQKIDYSSFDSIDILFSDFQHSPLAVLRCIANNLHKMSENSFIFIDSASTYFPSFQLLNNLVSNLNQNSIPKTLLEIIDPSNLLKFQQKVFSSKFELTHIIENKDRNQNSTAQIKILPNDLMPQPRINIRF